MVRVLFRSSLWGVLCFGSAVQARVNAPAPQLPPEWSEISPGGDTSCMHNTPFSFFFSPGTTNKVVIDFMGGGACWKAELCEQGSASAIESVEQFKKEFGDKLQGIYDRKEASNPLKEWNHIFIPYCTGDLHWGSNDKTYTEANGRTYVVKHRGANNVKAVLKWVQERFANPENVLVSGCSAGAYASAFWLPKIRESYPQSTVSQFGDSGISPITETFAEEAFGNWNIYKEGPSWVPGLNPNDVKWSRLQIDYIYQKIGSHYPNVRFAHFTSAQDGVQQFFYEKMGGDTSQWNTIVNKTLHTLSSEMNFNYFVTPGSQHCVLPYDRFNSDKSKDGLAFKDWFSSYVRGERVQNIDCVDCKDDDEFSEELEMYKSEF